MDSYLDIETTGLSCRYADITVIGIYLVNSRNSRLVQLVGRDVTVDNLLNSIDGVGKSTPITAAALTCPLFMALWALTLLILSLTMT